METDLSYLPERKRAELETIAALIRDMAEAEMIVLYGSYARGDWKEEKDLAEERWSGHPSDYDIFVVVEEQKTAEDTLLWNKVTEALRATRFSASPRLIIADVNDVNMQLAEGRYFYRDIREEGRLLYDSGRYQLAEPQELGPKERLRLVEDYFGTGIEAAQDFYEYSQVAAEKADCRRAAFLLNQSAESAYKTILLVHTLYSPHEHLLMTLAEQAAEFGPVFTEIFPLHDEKAAERFQLLDAAYIGARYHLRFKVTQDDLDYLAPRVKQLLEVADSVCRRELERLRASI